MNEIRLPSGAWFYDDSRPLGHPGGFGEVFEGRDSDGRPVAIKRLKVTADQAAHRELRVAEELRGQSFQHVLVPLDSGQDANSGRYFIAMPRADRSLGDEIAQHGSMAGQAIDVLRQVVAGLDEIPHLVHRDLKPANILFHDGKWKIADFGIARFVEESTSAETLKTFLSPPFAAPEQWRNEHATAATDLYALGCIAYALYTGRPPFGGPTPADYQRQHLNDAPPALTGPDPRVSALMSGCLRKPPSGRPDRKRITAVLNDVAQTTSTESETLKALRVVNAVEAERLAQRAAAAEAERTRTLRNQELVKAGAAVFMVMMTEVERVARDNASEALIRRPTPDALSISLGESLLTMAYDGGLSEPRLLELAKWEILAIGHIRVRQTGENPWSHGSSLWYMRREPAAPFRWQEVSFKQNPFTSTTVSGPFPIQDVRRADPFKEADLAMIAMHVVQKEFGPAPVDDENLADFVERWIHRFVLAAQGRLRPF